MEADETLERKALRNTRALIDKLEAEEATRQRSQKRALRFIGIACLVAVAIAAFISLREPPETAAARKPRPCEVDAWSAKSAELTAKIRAANPEMPYADIAKKLKAEQATIEEAVREKCGGAKGAK